jgi:hypothetical protein
LSTAPFIRLFSASVILNGDFELYSSFCGKELGEDADERLGDKATTEVIVGVIAIVNDITMIITNNNENLFGRWSYNKYVNQRKIVYKVLLNLLSLGECC